MDANQPSLYDNLRPLDSKEAEESIKEKLVNLFQRQMRLYGLDHRHRNQVLKISETINLLIENNFSFLECEEGINQACDSSPKYFPQALEILAETKRYAQRNKKAPLAIKSESEGDKAKVESKRRERAKKRLHYLFDQETVNTIISEYLLSKGMPNSEFFHEIFYADILDGEGDAVKLINKYKAMK